MKIKETVLYFKKEFTENDISALGSQVAYSLIIAIFPFLIFLITLLSFTNLIDVNLLLQNIKEVLPEEAYDIVGKTINEVFTVRNTGLLSVSILGSIWSASNGIKAIVKSINKAYEVKETRNFIKLILVAIAGVFMLATIIMVLLALIVFGDVIINFLHYTFHFPEILIKVLEIIRPLFTIAMLTLGFSVMYTFLPNKKVNWKHTLIGSFITTLMLLIISVAFSFYVNNFSNYSKVYGSIGGIIILLTWLFLASIAIIVGGEVNAYVMKVSEVKSEVK